MNQSTAPSHAQELPESSPPPPRGSFHVTEECMGEPTSQFGASETLLQLEQLPPLPHPLSSPQPVFARNLSTLSNLSQPQLLSESMEPRQESGPHPENLQLNNTLEASPDFSVPSARSAERGREQRVRARRGRGTRASRIQRCVDTGRSICDFRGGVHFAVTIRAQTIRTEDTVRHSNAPNVTHTFVCEHIQGLESIAGTFGIRQSGWSLVRPLVAVIYREVSRRRLQVIQMF